MAALSEPGASVSLVARRYDVNANQLFKWRRQLAAPSPDAPVAQVSLLPVEIVAPPGPAPLAAPPAASAKPVSGSIEIALAGGIRVKIKGAVDPAAVSAAVGAVMAARRRR